MKLLIESALHDRMLGAGLACAIIGPIVGLLSLFLPE